MYSCNRESVRACAYVYPGLVFFMLAICNKMSGFVVKESLMFLSFHKRPSIGLDPFTSAVRSAVSIDFLHYRKNDLKSTTYEASEHEREIGEREREIERERERYRG